jgi:Contractile injection system tube protein/LysM domain
MSGAPAKARITILHGDKSNSESEKYINVLFNPKEYTIQRTVKWTPAKNAGKNMPQMEFTNGEPATMQLELFFDTYEEKDDARDVRKHTKKLWDLMVIDPKIKDAKSKKGQPSDILFQWGKGEKFNAVVQSVAQKFTMFLNDGTPVRATLTVVLLQVQDTTVQKGTNPTSGGDGGERIWTVQQGETLSLIAHRTLGDTKAWRSIAAMNRLEDVRKLEPGTVLVIPNA